jgi:VCBS repeat-containing protein
MLPATTRTLAALLGALLLTHAPAAQAITKKGATRKALDALGVAKADAPVIVFRLQRPLRAGARISQAGTARQPSRRAARTGVIAKAAPALATMREPAYFFFADQAPSAAYQHMGRAVLVGRHSGKVRISKPLMWPPLIDNRLPAFMRSADAYQDPANRAYQRLSQAAVSATAAPDALSRGRVANRLAADRSCIVQVSDTLGDLYAFGGAKRTRTRLSALFASLKQLAPGIVAERYSPGSGVTPTRFAERLIAARGCRDVLLYLAGGAWAKTRTPAVAVGARPGPGARIRQQLVTAGDVLKLLRAHRGATFSVIADAPYADRFTAALKGERNAQVVAAPAGSWQRGAALPGGRIDGLPDMLELTNRALDGIDRILSCGSEIDAAGAGSFLAWMIARGLQVGENPASATRCTFPSLPNRAPTAAPASVSTPEDVPLLIPLPVADPDGDALTVSATAPSHGTVAVGTTVTYTPAPDFNGTDSFTYSVSDGRGGTASATVTVTVDPVDDAATVATTAGVLAYTEGDQPAAIDGALIVSDVDDAELERATVRVTTGLQAGDELRFTDQRGISGAYDAVAGVLTLTGAASLADYQAALRTVAYVHTGDDPGAAKTVAFQADDGDGLGPAASRAVSVLPVNDPPTVVASAGTAAFLEAGGPVAIDPQLAVGDPDSALLSGASVEITTGFAPAEDALHFSDQNGITGAYNAGMLTLSGVATVASYRDALRSVTYDNSSITPSTANRTVAFEVTDAGGLTSAAATREVRITSVANAPVVTTSAGATPYSEGDAATAIDSALTVTDADDTQLAGASVRLTTGRQAADELTFANQPPISGVYDPATGVLTLTGTASVAAYQAALRSVRYRHTGDDPSTAKSVEFVARDSAVTGAAAAKAIAVTPVNDAPQLTTSGASLAYTENAGPTAIDGALTVADPDSPLNGATVTISAGFAAGQDRLAFTNQLGISGSYDQAAGVLTLTGAAPAASYQTALRAVTYANLSDSPSATRTITFRVTDGAAQSNAATRGIAITATNDPPAAVADTGTTNEDTTLNVVASGVLANDTDPDAGDAKTVTRLNGSATLTGTSAKGAAVTINANGAYAYNPGGVFQGLSTGQSDTDSFSYTMRDTAGATSTATVTITITGVSDAPVAVADTFDAIGNTSLYVGTARPAAEPAKEITGSLLTNDTDPDTPRAGLAAVPVTDAPTTLGGTITIEADGNFTYRPDDGDTGVTDTFTYTVSDGVATGSGTLSLPISGQVWYVRNTAANGGDGTSDGPFNTLAAAETASGTGDTVYVLNGNGTPLGGGYVLEANERLIGEHAGLSIGGVTLHAAGTRSALTATNKDVVTLASGAVVAGLSLDPSGTGGAISGGAGTNGATISDITIDDAGTAGAQPGLELDGTTGTTNVSDLTVSTNGATGIRLNNAGTVDLGSTTITTTGARGLDATGTSMGTTTFDSITAAGVRMTNTTGSTTFGGLQLTSTFALGNAGSVTVAAAGTANVSATGVPAVDVTGTSGATLAFDAVNSTNSASDGINLAGLGSGTFSASSGAISGAAGIAFDLDGGSGAITYAGAIDNGTGATAEITNRTGGGVTLSGNIADTSDAGGGVALSGNSGGSTTFSGASKVLNSGASDAVAMTSSDGHTLTLSGGGLDIDATSGRGLAATTSGTLVVSGTGNTIDTTTGRALTVTATDIGAAGATFQRISSNGAPNGILLDTTGSAGGLAVTGNGGTCTGADTSGCSGGEIRNAPGADDSGSTPAGTGIVLKDTSAPSLTRVWLHDHANYAIRGTNVAGFTLADSVVNGTNGTNGTTPFDDSSVWFTNLTGSAAVTRAAISGGYEDNFRVNNSSGSLNRITFSSVAMGLNGTANGNDSLSLQSQASAGQLHATVQNSAFTGAPGDVIDYQHNGSGTGDLVLNGNAFSNSHPSIATGGGGLTLSNSGASGATTMSITGNTFRDAVGAGVLIVKTAGAATQTGTFSNNTIGVAGVANSGSREGSGLQLQLVDQGSSRWTVANNQIRGYNNNGITVTAGGGSTPQSGTINTTITGNTIAQPGTTPGTITLPKQGVHLNIGTVPGDTFQACAAITGNTLAASGADGVPATGIDADVRLRQRQSSTIRLPGYAGSTTDTAAVQSFVAANNPGGASVLASVSSPPGGGFTGTGTTCP